MGTPRCYTTIGRIWQGHYTTAVSVAGHLLRAPASSHIRRIESYHRGPTVPHHLDTWGTALSRDVLVQVRTVY